MEHDKDSRSTAWSSQSDATSNVVKFQPYLESLLDSESHLWRSPELRVLGQEGSSQVCAWQSHAHDGHCVLNHAGLVHVVHDYYRNLEKNRCCLTLAGRRKVMNTVRVVGDGDTNDGSPPSAPLPPSSVRSRQSRRAEVVLSGDQVTLYQCALLSAFLPVLAAPGPPSPFTPALPTTPTDAGAHGAAFSFGGASTAGDKETPLLRRSAAASALANLEKDVGSSGDLSTLVACAEYQYDRQAVKTGSAPVATLDSVTTEMLRELVRLIFKQSEQQQMCSEHDLRDLLGRRTYSEVLARHLMARLSVLENNSHQFYRPTAFLVPQAYDEWVQGEKQHIKQLLNRFWHYSLPHPTRPSSSSISSRLLRFDHHSAYVQVLERVVHQQESVKRHPGVPLLPTARRLLKEFALRFGVGELFCRVSYLRLLSQNMEHDVWFCRHACVSLLAVLELLPFKSSQRTAAVKCELERLHEAVATLHSHVDHALTRVHILFPNNSPPDGIQSMLQLLSLVLFTQRYLTNQAGQSISNWVQRYLHDGFAWRYEYHKTVLSSELEIKSAEYPLTPALLNGLLVELRNEVNGLADSFEISFKRYFSVSHIARHSFYQLLMQDVQELCHYKLPPVEQLELDMLALMFRLAELDSNWSSSVSLAEQVWREPFFLLLLSWLKVLQTHAVRWLLTACVSDSWNVLTIPAFQPPEAGMHLQPQEGTAALPSTPLTQAFRPTGQSVGSFTLGTSGLSAFTRSRSVSAVALAGSFTASDQLSEAFTNPVLASAALQRPRSNTMSSHTSSLDDDSHRHSAALHQRTASSDMPGFDRVLSLPPDEKLWQTPALSFMCHRPVDKLSPVHIGAVRPASDSKQASRGSSKELTLPGYLPQRSTSAPQQQQQLFRTESLVPARPATLFTSCTEAQSANSRKNALFKPMPIGSGAPRSVSQVIPSPVSPFGNRFRRSSAVDSIGDFTLPSGAFSPPRNVSTVSAPAMGSLEERSVEKHRTAEWVASMSQSDDNETARSASANAARPLPSVSGKHPPAALNDSPLRSTSASCSYHQPDDSTIVAGGSQAAGVRKISGQAAGLLAAERKLSSQSTGAATMERKLSSQGADHQGVERKISTQSNDSVHTARFSVGEGPFFASVAEHEQRLVRSERVLPVSSSLVDLAVVLSRLASSIASLTVVVCPSMASAPNTPMSATSNFSLAGKDSSQADHDAANSAIRWHKSMDVNATAAQMQKQVFAESLEMVSELSMLYADNMLCADLCGLPEGIASCLIGNDLLSHIQQRHRESLLWGCRHHHVAERCSSSRSPSPAHAGQDVYDNDVRCSSRCVAGGDLPSIEPIAAEMCTRVNNIRSLLSTYPLLHTCMLERVSQMSQYPGRDSGLPFSPLAGVDAVSEGVAELQCKKVCAHVSKVLDAMINIMAHRINMFVAPCLRELLDLRLPASYSLAEHMLPVTQCLSRHLSQLKACLYDISFQSLLVVLWKMVVQCLQKIHFDSLQLGKRKVRLEDEARFLLRVVAHFMQFFHCGSKGLDMETVSDASQRLIHHLNIVAMPTTSLMSLHQRLHNRVQYASVQGAVGVQPGLVQALRKDLHALRKCFSGRDLCNWLSARCGQYGIASSQQSQLRIAQTLLSLGVICMVDGSSDAGGGNPSSSSSSMPVLVFSDSGSVLYRLADSEDCSSDSAAGQLLCSLEIDRLKDSRLEDSFASATGTTAPARNTAIDAILSVLRSRSAYDRDAKAYLSRTGTVS